MRYSYKFPHPALTVDGVVFGLDNESLKILLIQRKLEPFRGKWALPGGFVHIDESLDDAVRRELFEETGLEKVFLEQLYTFGDPARDPRERVVSVAYYALVNISDHKIRASTDAKNASWFPISPPPKLAFDHPKILQTALLRLQGKIRYQPVGFELLPIKFTLTQLQHLYETILERPLDKRNFRKKILGMNLLVKLDDYEKDVAHRAAALYRFDKRRYRQLLKQGFHFEI